MIPTYPKSCLLTVKIDEHRIVVMPRGIDQPYHYFMAVTDRIRYRDGDILVTADQFLLIRDSIENYMEEGKV